MGGKRERVKEEDKRQPSKKTIAREIGSEANSFAVFGEPWSESDEGND